MPLLKTVDTNTSRKKNVMVINLTKSANVLHKEKQYSHVLNIQISLNKNIS